MWRRAKKSGSYHMNYSTPVWPSTLPINLRGGHTTFFKVAALLLPKHYTYYYDTTGRKPC
jgi:hypothetical protein